MKSNEEKERKIFKKSLQIEKFEPNKKKILKTDIPKPLTQNNAMEVDDEIENVSLKNIKNFARIFDKEKTKHLNKKQPDTTFEIKKGEGKLMEFDTLLELYTDQEKNIKHISKKKCKEKRSFKFGSKFD